jgi:hypothetical protein
LTGRELHLEGLGERMHHEPAGDRLLEHLRNRHEIDAASATKLSVHNTYVFRIDRRDGEPWIARAFPPARPKVGVEGDAAILRFLERLGLLADLLGRLVMAATVIWLAVDLDRLRREAVDTRFTFVAVGYELACIAFVVGAVLGALLGVQWVRGAWYGAARLAHLHINVLGWGGLTLLTTVVFLGPRIMGTDMRPRAAGQAVWALRATATGLLVAVVALLLTGPRPGVVWPRSLAAVGLAIYAAGAPSVAWHVLRSGRTAPGSIQANMIRLACVWFVVIVTADAAAFGSGELGAVAIRAGWALAATPVLAHVALIASAATHRVPSAR